MFEVRQTFLELVGELAFAINDDRAPISSIRYQR
jgi:hypothetical protein